MSSQLHPMLNVAIKAARLAGTIINRATFDVDKLEITTKQTNDFVTEVDQAAEKAIIDTLLTAYPDHGILAEESGETKGKHGGADHVWIIDPLDGTTNFIHGFPVYCVSIALAVKGRIEQAVIYDPNRNDLFCATKGRGAYLNDKRIRVSKRIALRDSLLSTGFPFRPGDSMPTYLAILADIMPRCAGLRRPGSAALDLAYLAAGYTDGFFETGLSPWDIAAGSLLVTEAGGLIGNYSGEPDFLYQRECVAGNPKIYSQLVGVLSKYSKFASAGEKATVRQSLQSKAKLSIAKSTEDQPKPDTPELARASSLSAAIEAAKGGNFAPLGVAIRNRLGSDGVKYDPLNHKNTDPRYGWRFIPKFNQTGVQLWAANVLAAQKRYEKDSDAGYEARIKNLLVFNDVLEAIQSVNECTSQSIDLNKPNTPPSEDAAPF